MKPALGSFLLAFAALSGALAAANGGTLRLANAVAGPYLVSVWTEASPKPGPVDTSVAVMHPDSREAVLTARVTMVADLLGGSAPTITTTAVRGAGGNLLLYHAELHLPAAGRWRIQIISAGPNGTGTTQFDLVVATPRVPALAFVGAAGAASVAGWLLWRAKTRRRLARTPSSSSVHR